MTVKSGITNSAFIGVSNFHVAPLTSDPSDGTPVYGESIHIPKLKQVQIKPTTNSATLYADNAACDTANTVSDYKLTIATASLPLEYRAMLLGHTLDDKGVLHVGADDTAPYFAVMFESLKSNGKKRYIRFTKVQFAEPSDDFKTKEDKISYNTPSMEATAIYRDSDHIAVEYGDEEDDAFKDAATWFDLVPKS